MDELINKELLYDLYVNKKLSTREIGKIIHRRPKYVSECVDYYKFPRLECKKHHIADKDTIKEWIRLYKEENKSSTEIAKLYNTTHRTVLNTLIENGIERRTLSDSQRAKVNKESYSDDLLDYNIMYDLYVNKKLTLNTISKKYDCAPHYVRKMLEQLKIPIRTQSEVKIGLLTGSDHPNWKGGITPLYMRLREFFNTNQAPVIRKRDHYSCQLCGSHNKLHVHHIRPFVDIVDEILAEHTDMNPIDNINELYEICITDNRLLDDNNLITYCKNCHFYKIHNYNRTTSSEAS